jgi:hypothetical protein
MITINEEELQQLTAECGVTIHDSVDALSAYELSLLDVRSQNARCCVRVKPLLQRPSARVHAYY